LKLWKSLATAAAMLLALPLHAATAQEVTTTEDLINRGTVNVGIIMDSPPYGYLDANQQPLGFDVGVAQLLAKYMGVELNIVPLVGANRIPFLQTGKVDLIVAALGITPERSLQVAYSAPYMLVDNVVFAPKDLKAESVQDLYGKRVAVVRGSAQDTILTRDLEGHAELMRFDENPSLIQAMLTGQVDAIALTAVLGEETFAAQPQANIERKFTILAQANGVGMLKQNTELRDWVNTFVFYIKSNGELDNLYREYWKIPLPANMPTF
jgi:polar amino acid transport system substrate-binding protein